MRLQSTYGYVALKEQLKDKTNRIFDRVTPLFLSVNYSFDLNP